MATNQDPKGLDTEKNRGFFVPLGRFKRRDRAMSKMKDKNNNK